MASKAGKSAFSVAFAVALAAICTFLPARAGAEPTIRVAIMRSYKQIKVTGKGLRAGVITKEGAAGEMVGFNPTSIVVIPNGDLLAIKGLEQHFLGVTIDADQGLLKLNGKAYIGPLEIIRDRKKGGMAVVSEVPLEEYLEGVVGSEMPWMWPAEALKAQAVAARTYAVHQRTETEDHFYHIEATVLGQVYGGAGFKRQPVIDAVKATRGLVLGYNHHPVQAYFHSTCGGRTESAADLWGQSLPYLPGSKCGYCEASPNRRWTVTIPLKQLQRGLQKRKLASGEIKNIEIHRRLKSGRVKQVKVTTNKGKYLVTGNQLRAAVGYSKLKSAWFGLKIHGSRITFTGRGSGHGVGLCQWGARGMAEKGAGFAKILLHYYPRAEILKMY